MTSTPVSTIGQWELYFEPGFYVVNPAGQTVLIFREAADYSQSYGEAIVQFNTAVLPPGDIVDSVTLTFKTNANSAVIFDFYTGTWAATPPAANFATFSGGTLVGSQLLVAGAGITQTIDFDPSAINFLGVTSLRIWTHGTLNQLSYIFSDSSLFLTIQHHHPLPARKLHFARIP